MRKGVRHAIRIHGGMCALHEYRGVHGGGSYSFHVLGVVEGCKGRLEKRRDRLHPPEYSKQQRDSYRDVTNNYVIITMMYLLR